VTVALEQIFQLGRRSVVRTARQPANIVGPMIFPMMLLAVNSGGLKAETRLPGFPTHSFVAFALAVPFIQGALFATINAGTDLARDIQTGFLSRLALTRCGASPCSPASSAAWSRSASCKPASTWSSGSRSRAAGLGDRRRLRPAPLRRARHPRLRGIRDVRSALRRLRRDGAELFPAFFVFLFISSMNVPRNLIGVRWFHDAATVNPVSYLIECVRSLIITAGMRRRSRSASGSRRCSWS